MTSQLSLELDVTVKDESINDLFSDLSSKLSEAWSDPLATFKTEAVDSLKDLGEAWEKTLKDGWKDTASTLGGAITDSISPFFDGEMDKVEEIWDKAWENMGGIVDKVLNGMIKDAFTELGNYVGEVFKQLVIAPVKAWLKESLDIAELFKDTSSDSSFSPFFSSPLNSVKEFDGGVTGLNTGFDSVYDTATGLFQQTEQGTGDSLDAIQDYQISGLAPLWPMVTATSSPPSWACFRAPTIRPSAK